MKPIIVDAPQRSDEWFAARLGKVTGSKAADTMAYYAVTKKMVADAVFRLEEEVNADDRLPDDVIEKLSVDYPTELVIRAGIEIGEKSERKRYRENIVAERLTGLASEPDPYVTHDMKWGMASEAIAKSLYQMQKRVIVDEAPLMLHPELACGASPDGLTYDRETGELGNIECKSLRTANHLYKIIKEHKVPAEYMPQIQMQMWINGRGWCDFIGFDSRLPEGLKLFTQRVERDDFYIDFVLEPSIRRFLGECDKDERHFRAMIRQRQETM